MSMLIRQTIFHLLPSIAFDRIKFRFKSYVQLQELPGIEIGIGIGIENRPGDSTPIPIVRVETGSYLPVPPTDPYERD